ncbi:hypothetical protein GGH96_000002 [Coemansia sp. RSA 1972]|nr:hypothetical protein GGH96_000002 [Coemansia sp. RSA 1972]
MLNISSSSDWHIANSQDPLPPISSYRIKHPVAAKKLPAASNALVGQQHDADPESGHTLQLIWACMTVLAVSLCGIFVSLHQGKHSTKKVIAAQDDLARIVYSMPNSLFGVNTEKLAELKNEIDNIKSLLNINIADSNDVAHKNMKCATEIETLTRQISNLPIELFEYTSADDALAAGHAARNLIVESNDSVGNTTSNDGDGTVAGTSTIDSDDENGVWQTVVVKRNPHSANRGQKKPKRNRKAKK